MGHIDDRAPILAAVKCLKLHLADAETYIKEARHNDDGCSYSGTVPDRVSQSSKPTPMVMVSMLQEPGSTWFLELTGACAMPAGMAGIDGGIQLHAGFNSVEKVLKHFAGRFPVHSSPAQPRNNAILSAPRRHQSLGQIDVRLYDFAYHTTHPADRCVRETVLGPLTY